MSQIGLDWKMVTKCFRPQIEILADRQTAASTPVWKWQKALKKRILPRKSLFFGRILMLPKIALFVQNFWSKLIVFWRIATILQYFRGNQLWLMISHQLHCFCSIKSGKRHDSTKRDVCRQRFANRDEGRLQIAMHAVHLFLELWIMTFLDGKP